LTVGSDGIPRARCADGTEVPFHFLHFQGDAKSLITKFVWRGAMPFWQRSEFRRWLSGPHPLLRPRSRWIALRQWLRGAN
jgi:hypothetical protein